MADEIAVFDIETGQTILSKIENLKPVPNRLGESIPQSAEFTVGRTCWAEITEATEVGGIYFHAWKQIRVATAGFEDVTSGLSGTTADRPIINPDLTELPVGTRVFVRLEIYTDSGTEKGRWVVVGAPGGGGETIPTAEYPHMPYQSSSSNSNVFDFVRISPVFD